ncbi:Leukemia inhibitory factor receptor, partial [Microtus ochrogaster]
DFVHPTDQFQPGVRYNFYLYGCTHQGYQLLRSIIGYIEELGHSDIKLKNITDISQKTLRIADLQGKTSYHLVLRAYTHGGLGPEKSMFVVTKENSVGLIIAILIPVAVAVIVGVVTSILCYRKREWIKETFYPDIPNPENCKALQFQKSLCEVTLCSMCLRLGTRGLLLSVFCEKLVMSARERSMRKVACFSIC